MFAELTAELAQKASARAVTKIFVKLKFSDFTRTTVERAGLEPTLDICRYPGAAAGREPVVVARDRG